MAEEKDKTKVEEQEKNLERKEEKGTLEKQTPKDIKNDSKTKQEDKKNVGTEKTKEESKKKDEKSREGEKEIEKKEEKPKEKKSESKNKKTSASVNLSNLPISTKHSKAICKFIRNRKIEDAINDLEKVSIGKKAVPMKGEIPHRKGEGMMSGRFPKKASESFVKILKSLSANASYNGIEEPVIVEAVANIGARPYGRFGRVRMKRTHIKVVAKSQENKKLKKK
ncbi:MAG: uL22 family ribosomal protein [Candidatus Pacearchaeota archaeon]